MTARIGLQMMTTATSKKIPRKPRGFKEPTDGQASAEISSGRTAAARAPDIARRHHHHHHRRERAAVVGAGSSNIGDSHPRRTNRSAVLGNGSGA